MALIDAVYSRVTPGVNAPNDAGVPSVSDRVAGTVPATPPSTSFQQRGAVGSLAGPGTQA